MKRIWRSKEKRKWMERGADADGYADERKTRKKWKCKKM